MGYGIYREQPNAMAINQGFECQLYQYPLYTVMGALVHTEKKILHTHTHLKIDLYFSLFSWEQHYVDEVLCLTLILFRCLKLGRTQRNGMNTSLTQSRGKAWEMAHILLCRELQIAFE